MGKVFTITEGLDNLGAMKTGGQGSVYKGRRIGEIITAIKLLPTPIHTESEEDKSFVDFQNEVQKLKKVNERPNPNVVKILSSGVSDTGNFPFIEMEFIEGPDLEELLKPPYDRIFTTKEVIKVADQLSNALAHCHKVEVRHGDIKSNNVKFNIHTGNYVLLDFGLAVMSDEQRRSSLRHAGAIEFMAPEQNEGQMLYQTDVYSLGVILFELLTGNVPFPLNDKGETARNTVRLSHMETPAPDILEKRRQALPESWSDEKKQHEMHVPGWLLSMIYKCLEKKPENRFENGIELHDYIVLNSTLAAKKEEVNAVEYSSFQAENKKLMAEKDQLQQVILKYQKEALVKDKQLEELRASAMRKEHEPISLQQTALPQTQYDAPPQKGVSRTAFMVLLMLTIGLAAFATYTYFSNKSTSTDQLSTTDSTSTVPLDTAAYSINRREQKTNPTVANTQRPVQTNQQNKNKSNASDSAQADNENGEDSNTENTDNASGNEEQSNEDETEKKDKSYGRYKVKDVAYFHNRPDQTTRRNAFINHWNNAILNPLDEQGDYIYIVYTNDEGQVSKGWLSKKDLIRVKE